VAGPVQDLDSGFWPGHRVLTGSSSLDRVAGSIPILLKKSKRRCFSKKKIQRVATWFLTGFCRINPPDRPSHDFFYFFINPIQFQSRICHIPDRPTRGGFQNYIPIWLTFNLCINYTKFTGIRKLHSINSRFNQLPCRPKSLWKILGYFLIIR